MTILNATPMGRIAEPREIAAVVAFLALPLATILAKALQDKDGAFVGLHNFASYLATPALLQSFVNSVWVAALVTVVTVPLAFGFFGHAIQGAQIADVPCRSNAMTGFYAAQLAHGEHQLLGGLLYREALLHPE